MLDVVMVLIVVVLTGATLLYAEGCDQLMRTDSTRESGIDTP